MIIKIYNKIKTNLFLSTRFKLDIVAVIFVSFILSFFSYTVYRLLTLDLIYQISPVFRNSDISTYLDIDNLFNNFKQQTIFLLIVLDIIIFFLSIFVFDSLVKRMLAPIEYVSNLQKKFAENLSHELRTPLAVISVQSEILLNKLEKEEIKSNFDEKFLNNFRNSLSTIDLETKGITDLISDLLFEARLKYGEEKIENVSLGEVIKILNKVLDNISTNKSNSVEVIILNKVKEFEENTFLKVNKIHLERIFNNLISNSFKFTKSGEIKIVLEKYRFRLKESFRFSINDTGIGIQKEDLKQVSNRFFRGKNIENEIAGTGIGLSIVKDIVNKYDWRFHIESQENSGTKIEISKINIF